jgi:type VI secretion system secreted protein Hcp
MPISPAVKLLSELAVRRLEIVCLVADRHAGPERARPRKCHPMLQRSEVHELPAKHRTAARRQRFRRAEAFWRLCSLSLANSYQFVQAGTPAKGEHLVERTLISRFGLPVAAALVTSAVVAAFALGEGGAGNANAGAPPKATGQPAGQLVIDGETIPVLAFSAGVSNSGSVVIGGGGGAGKASFSSLNLTTTVDANTPALTAAVASGKHFPTAVFTATWGAGSASSSLTYTLDNVVISSIAHSGAGEAPAQSISIDFAKIKWTFTDANGTTTAGWDLVTNSSN